MSVLNINSILKIDDDVREPPLPRPQGTGAPALQSLPCEKSPQLFDFDGVRDLGCENRYNISFKLGA